MRGSAPSDPTLTIRPERWRRMPGRTARTTLIAPIMFGREHRLDIGLRRKFDRAVSGHAGSVHDDVDPTSNGLNTSDRFQNGFVGCHVQSHEFNSDIGAGRSELKGTPPCSRYLVLNNRHSWNRTSTSRTSRCSRHACSIVQRIVTRVPPQTSTGRVLPSSGLKVTMPGHITGAEANDSAFDRRSAAVAPCTQIRTLVPSTTSITGLRRLLPATSYPIAALPHRWSSPSRPSPIRTRPDGTLTIPDILLAGITMESSRDHARSCPRLVDERL